MNFAYQKKYSNQIIQRYDIHGAHQGQSSPQVMSGGNRQKMVFARSINQPYQLLILFNPTQALDHQATAKLQQAMLSEKKKKKSIILISSNLEELMQVSDRIIVISHGQKISDELTKDVSLHQIAEKITLLNSKLKPQSIRIN